MEQISVLDRGEKHDWYWLNYLILYLRSVLSFIILEDNEDAEYEAYYGDNDSTLEGVEHLKERFDMYGLSSYNVKIYSSNHYQYVPEMLLDYIKE